MKDFIKEIKDSYWFTNESPFRLHYVETGSKVCIITGQNASGKSFLRKILNARHQDDNIEYIHLSQCGRSSSSGLMRAMIYGSEEEDSTGYISVKAIRGAIRTGTARTKPFALMLDEPEIGCSEELALSLSHKLVNEIPNMLKLEKLYINTHSKNIIKPLLALNPSYVHLYAANDNVKYPTIQSWLDREIELLDIDLLYENANKNWSVIGKLIHNRKKS